MRPAVGLVGGFYAQGTHEIIEFDSCAIQHGQNDAVVAAVKRIARGLGISGYDAGSGRGVLRHVVAKVGVRTGEVIVVLLQTAPSCRKEISLFSKSGGKCRE